MCSSDLLKFCERQSYHARSLVKEFEALPEPPEQTHARKVGQEVRRRTLDEAFTPEGSAAGYWKNKRILEDAPVLAAEHLRDGDDHVIFLPAETSPYSGNFEPYAPETAVRFDSLPPDVLRQVRQAIRDRGADTPDEAFRAAWSVLHRTGYAGTGERSPAYRPQKAAPKAKAKPKTKRAGSAATVDSVVEEHCPDELASSF